MIEIDSVCIQNTTDSRIKFEEKQSKIIFRNLQRKECLKIQIDGCAITNGIRCDKLLKEGNKNQQGPEYYVELKGGDIEHALEQIIRTIQIIHNDASPIMAFIICSNVRPTASTHIQKQLVKLKKQFNATLIIKERQYEHDI